MAGRYLPPERERSLGLGFYVTETVGVGGALKERSEDFLVNEISAYPMPDPEGPFTVLRVASRDWEQHELAERIAQELRLAPHALDWAGTKDRRAVTERLFSYRGAPPTALSLPDVELREAYRARSGLVLGHHYGNVFDVRIPLEGLDPPTGVARSSATLGELRRVGGFANLFGLQRFGEVRPVTHLVGRALVRSGPAEAVEEYLTALPEAGDTVGREARLAYRADHDAVQALRAFPPHFRFERQLLDHLARGHPPERALRALSRELRLLFVHAYQAWLFNRWLTLRVDAGLSLAEPVAGDHLLRVARDGTVPGVGPVPVSDDNLSECREMVRRERARVAGPLFGYESPEMNGRPGELFRGLLEEEGVERQAFRLPHSPEVASKGSFRPILVPLPPVTVRTSDEGPSLEGDRPAGLWFRFALPKGTYATVLMREFTKAGAAER